MEGAPRRIVEPSAVTRHDRFIIRQRFRLVGNRYEIFVPTADGRREGELVGFVQQKIAALKEDLRAYTGHD
jgi:hypothetical protein